MDPRGGQAHYRSMTTRRFPLARITLAAPLLVMTCCQTPQPPPPAPPPIPRPVATQAPPPPQITLPPADNWIDRPQTPGDWSYAGSGAGGSMAVYGSRATEGVFSLRCEPAQRRIVLARTGAGAGPLVIRTETVSRALDARASGGELPRIEAELAASDPLLDAMAITRGRFAVEVPGTPGLYLPAWAEVTRVIEDCR